MIGYLRGKIIESTTEGDVLLDVAGVGYRVLVAGDIPTGDVVEFFVYTHVREDVLDLYGFKTKKEHSVFSLLLSVSGIGPKVAKIIVSLKKPDQVVLAVQKSDVEFFTGIPGIGKKGAQKIIIDLKNKMGSITDLDLSDDADDLVIALMGMGFERIRVVSIVKEIDESLTEKERLQIAIKSLSSKK